MKSSNVIQKNMCVFFEFQTKKETEITVTPGTLENHPTPKHLEKGALGSTLIYLIMKETIRIHAHADGFAGKYVFARSGLRKVGR